MGDAERIAAVARIVAGCVRAQRSGGRGLGDGRRRPISWSRPASLRPAEATRGRDDAPRRGARPAPRRPRARSPRVIRRRHAVQIRGIVDEVLDLVRAVAHLRELTPRTRDDIIAAGEKLSVRLLTAAC